MYIILYRITPAIQIKSKKIPEENMKFSTYIQESLDDDSMNKHPSNQTNYNSYRKEGFSDAEEEGFSDAEEEGFSDAEEEGFSDAEEEGFSDVGG